MTIDHTLYIHQLAAARGDTPADIVFKNGTILNVFSSELIIADVAVCGSMIVGIGSYTGKIEIDCTGKFLSPGLIDAHMHIESSMLLPGELSKVLVRAGTTTIIADPHEAVNVSGPAALDYLLQATENTLTDTYLMIPSSVPASDNDVNGCGRFTAEQMEKYKDHPRILGLGEVMRYHDVINGNQEMENKLQLFRNNHHRIDGHYSGLRGKQLQAYCFAGVQNCHESTSGEEALEKLRAGLTVFIREGSGAKNLEAVLKSLLSAGVSLDNCMFCTDDKHTEEIAREGHISTCVRKAIGLGVPPVQAYRMGSYQTARYYGLHKAGALAAGFTADILIMDDLESVFPQTVVKNGTMLNEQNYALSYDIPVPFTLCETVHPLQLGKNIISVPLEEKNTVISIVPGQLLTRKTFETLNGSHGLFVPDSVYNKLCVFERHGRSHRAAAAPFKGFGLKGGAIATSVSHDAHNIIVAGDNDEDILNAVSCLYTMQGGYAISAGGKIAGKLPLPVFGLMSTGSCTTVEKTLAEMIKLAGSLGVPQGVDPFITLSFMALTVIPEIRITDSGIIDVV